MLKKYAILIGATFLYGLAVWGITYSFWGRTAANGGAVAGGACLAGAVLALRTVELSEKYSQKYSEKSRVQIAGFSHLAGSLLRMGVPLIVAIFTLFFYKGGMDKEFTAGILISYAVYYPFTLVVELILTLPRKKRE